jgi:small redox-active disulfide protein 2
MKIQVLGPGCVRCRQLAQNVRLAIAQAGVACELEIVQDVAHIAEAGVLFTPALIIDGQIKSSDRVLTVDQIARLLVAA